MSDSVGLPRTPIRALAALLVLLSSASSLAGQTPAPRFERTACPFEGGEWLDRETIECGVVTVPENRAREAGRVLRLAVAVLRSTADRPAPDPVVFLMGGPGGAAVRSTRGFAANPLVRGMRVQRDFVLWDQRGTGYSEPAFCPDLADDLEALSLSPMATSERIVASVTLVAECRERLAGSLDFASYNSATSARDLDDIRRALGYEEWNLLGVSYGTRLALVAARDTPVGIRSMLLDAVSPTTVSGNDENPANFARSVELLLRACRDDLDCGPAFPGLEDSLHATIAELDREPLVVSVAGLAAFPRGEVVVDGRAFALGLFQGLYDQDLIAVVPLMIREVRRRNRELVAALAERLAPDPEGLNRWLHYAVECYEQAPLLGPDSASLEPEGRSPHPYGLIHDATFGPVCDAWHGERADTALLRRPVTADVPTLVASGEFDPITPPAYGRLVAGHLPRARHIEVRGMGHGTLPYTDCTRGLAGAFLDDPEGPLDTSCLAALPGVAFATDVLVTPAILRISKAFGSGESLAWKVWAAATGAVLLWALVAWPVSGLLARRRVGERAAAPGPGPRRLARPVAWLAALATLGFAVGLALVVRSVVAANPYVLAFGLPGAAAPLLWLPWAVLMLSLSILGFAALASHRKWWSRVRRIEYALVAAACASSVVLMARFGLLGG